MVLVPLAGPSDPPVGEKEPCGSPAVRMVQAGREGLRSRWDLLSAAGSLTGFCCRRALLGLGLHTVEFQQRSPPPWVEPGSKGLSY